MRAEHGPTCLISGGEPVVKLVDPLRLKRLDPGDFLARNDAYHFFAPLNALMKTGPTHTNVCDVRVIVTDGNT